MNGSIVGRGALALVGAVLLGAGCGSSGADTVAETPETAEPTLSAGTEGVSVAAGFEYDGRRVTAIHRLVGVDVNVMLAVRMSESCSLDPDATWRSAFASQELAAPRSPSVRLNDAWCDVAVHPPDGAEGFDC